MPREAACTDILHFLARVLATSGEPQSCHNASRCPGRRELRILQPCVGGYTSHRAIGTGRRLLIGTPPSGARRPQRPDRRQAGRARQAPQRESRVADGAGHPNKRPSSRSARREVSVDRHGEGRVPAAAAISRPAPHRPAASLPAAASAVGPRVPGRRARCAHPRVVHKRAPARREPAYPRRPARGLPVSRRRVARLMREAGLRDSRWTR